MRISTLGVPLIMGCVAAFLLVGCRKPADQKADQTRSTLGFLEMDKVYDDPDWIRMLGPASERGSIIARVNGEPIKREDLDSFLVEIIHERAIRKLPLDSKSMAKVRVNSLNTLITFALEKQEAVRQNIPIDKNKVDDLYDKYRKSYAGDEEFAKTLARFGETPRTFREICANKFRVDVLREQSLGKEVEEPTEKEIEEHWAKLENQFINVNASQILFRAPARMSTLEREQKRSLAERVRAEIKEDGSNFADLVLQYSEDETTKDKGGDLGRATISALPPGIAQVLKGRPVGWISDVVAVPNGFAVFRVTKVNRLTLEQIRQFVIIDLKRERRVANYNNWLYGIRDKSNIRILDEDIKSALSGIGETK